MGKNTSKQIEQILLKFLKNGEALHMFFRTAHPSLAWVSWAVSPSCAGLGQCLCIINFCPAPNRNRRWRCDVIWKLYQSPYRPLKTAIWDPDTWGKTPANTLNRFFSNFSRTENPPLMFFRTARPSLAWVSWAVSPSCAGLGPCLCITKLKSPVKVYCDWGVLSTCVSLFETKWPYETWTRGEKHQQALWTDSSQEWRTPSYVLSDSTSQPCMWCGPGALGLGCACAW